MAKGREERQMKEYIVVEHPDFPYEEPKPQELIRCKDCVRNPYNLPASVDVVHGTPERCWDLASRINAFCSEAERAEE